jgi:hypothetical protein
VRPGSIAVELNRAKCLAALVLFKWSILVRQNTPIITNSKIRKIDQPTRNLRPIAVIFECIKFIFKYIILFYRVQNYQEHKKIAKIFKMSPLNCLVLFKENFTF